MNIFTAFFHHFIFFNWLNLDQGYADQGLLGKAPRVQLVLIYKQSVFIKNYPASEEVFLFLNLLAQLTLVDDVIWHDLMERNTLKATLHFKVMLDLIRVDRCHMVAGRWGFRLLWNFFNDGNIGGWRLWLVVFVGRS